MSTQAVEAANEERREARRVGRRELTGLAFGLAGIALITLVAPNITGDTRTFAFEPPPDALDVSFNPRTLVTVIGVI